MDENRLAREQQTILRDYDDVRAELLAIPGVLGVGIGVKETGNQFTEEMSYRVWVAEKKPPEELALTELVPPQIGEFRTDVLTPLRVQEDSGVCGDERRTLSEHRPLQGGIAISTDSSSYGTLGWFATLDADDTTVLLTNKHVLYDAVNEITTVVKKTAQPLEDLADLQLSLQLYARGAGVGQGAQRMGYLPRTEAEILQSRDRWIRDADNRHLHPAVAERLQDSRVTARPTPPCSPPSRARGAPASATRFSSGAHATCSWYRAGTG